MICYNENDMKEMMVEQQVGYVMAHALFDTMQYKLVRLEVKWCYVACLNALIQNPSYDEKGRAYLKANDQHIIDILKDLAHKQVDQDKIDGYLNEMEAHQLIERQNENVYLKKICHIF